MNKTTLILNYSYSTELENIKNIYHYSIPNTKLYYPEPFIATASFLHYDAWFLHIIIYQYWLWFIFIFIIVFFFLMFLITVRWSNLKLKPKRETRGVSRSKCGDLITAIVPVSWAASIIIHETTDAIDFYDGFGTVDFVFGIKAYQWGWEYYYPKDVDFNFNRNDARSFYFGNSLKYNSKLTKNNSFLKFWKFYSFKPNDFNLTPFFFLIYSNSNYSIFNLVNFNISKNNLIEAQAFPKIQYSLKQLNLNTFQTHFNSNFYFNNFYNNLKSTIDRNNFYSFFFFKNMNNFSYSSFFNNNVNFSDLNPLNSFFKNFLNLNFSFIDLLKSKSYLTYYYNMIFFNNNDTYLFNLNYLFNNFFLVNKFKTIYHYPFLLKFISDKKEFYYLKLSLKKFLFKLKFINKNNFLLTNLYKKTCSPLIKIKNWSFFYKKGINYNLIQFNSRQIQLLMNKQNYFQFDDFINNYSNSVINNNLINYTYNSLFIKNKFFFNLYLSNKFFFSDTLNAIFSNNLFFKKINYNITHKKNTQNPINFFPKDELTPKSYLNDCWDFFFFNFSQKLKFLQIMFYNLNMFNNNSSITSLYYDYDFKKKQSNEMVEDLFYETSLNGDLHNEYFFLFKKKKKLSIKWYLIDEYLNKTKYYFSWDRLFVPISKDINYFYSNTHYIDDLILNWKLLAKNNFFFLNTIIELNENMDDSYWTHKMWLLFMLFFKNNIVLNNLFFFSSINLDIILNYYNANFENIFFNYDFNFQKNKIFFQFPLNNFNFFKTESLLNSIFSFKNTYDLYNSVQKIFRTKIDEYRSYCSMDLFINAEHNLPFMTNMTPHFNKSLKKNSFNYLNFNIFNFKLNFNINEVFFLNNFFSYTIFDLPFLLSFTSDLIRYTWIDWYTKWVIRDVQYISLVKYNLNGMVNFSHLFDFTNDLKEYYYYRENYTSRLQRFRKTPIQNFSHSPNFLLKLTKNFYLQSFLNYKNITSSSIIRNIYLTEYLLDLKYIYSNKNMNNWFFNSGNSNIFTKSKRYYQINNNFNVYSYKISLLFDILTKREYLIKTIILSNKKSLNLPFNYNVTSNNNIILDYQFIFFIYNSLNTNFFNNTSFIYYFLNFFNLNYNSNNFILKNQYKPLKKGIASMVRLYASNSLALPIEMRIQVLASSKDVIHSWAIPSAGVKIDCIPGYSSHRLVIFFLSGIYWGQCMEICGRYHHWMPIVLYFLKRDLFFVWCLHFILLNKNNKISNSTDTNLFNFYKPVSFNKNSWFLELLLNK